MNIDVTQAVAYIEFAPESDVVVVTQNVAYIEFAPESDVVVVTQNVAYVELTSNENVTVTQALAYVELAPNQTAIVTQALAYVELEDNAELRVTQFRVYEQGIDTSAKTSIFGVDVELDGDSAFFSTFGVDAELDSGSLFFTTFGVDVEFAPIDQPSYGPIVFGNTIESTIGEALYVDGVGGVTLSSNRIVSCDTDAITTISAPLLRISENFVDIAGGYGIVLDSCIRADITNNELLATALAGISLDWCDLTRISENRILSGFAPPSYAVEIGHNCSNVAVVQNDFRGGFVLDKILDNGFATFAERNLPEEPFAELVSDVVGSLIIDSTTIDFTYDDGANTLTGIVIPGTVDADMVDGYHAVSFMRIAVYDTNADGTVDSADTVAWTGVTGIPLEFPPEDHTHDVLPLILDALHEHVVQEDWSGACDGAKLNFVLTNEFEPETTQVWLNGLLQRPAVSYTEDVTYDAITFSIAPIVTDELIVAYLIA